MYKKFLNVFLVAALAVAGTMFTSCQDYDEDIKDLQSQINAQNTTLTSLIEEKIASVESEISNLQSQLKDLDAAYKAADEVLKGLIEAAEANAKAYADKVAAAAQESAQAYADAVAAAAEQAAKDYALIQAQQAEAAAIAAAEEMVAAAIVQLEAELAEAVATLNGRIDDVEEEITSLKAELLEKITSVEIELKDDMGSLYDYLKSLIDEMDDAVSDILADIEGIKTRLDNHDIAIADLIAADAALQLGIDEAKAAATKAQEQADLAYELAQQNYTSIQNLITQVEGIIENVDDLSDSLENLTAVVDGLSSALSSLTEVVNNLSGTVADLSKTVQSLEDQVSILNSQMESVMEELLLQAADIASLQGDVKDLFDSNKEILTWLSTLQGQFDDLEGYYATLAQLVEDNQKAVEKALADLEEEMTQAIADALTEAEAYVDDAIDDLTEYIEGKFDDIDTDIQTLYTLANQIQIDLSALTSTVDDLTSKVETLETTLADLNQFFVLGDRLTSLVFAPTTYVDGIASICFSHVTFTYDVWEITNGVPSQTSTEVGIDVADEAHVEEYLYSPSHVAAASVASLDFVSNTATNISTKAVSDSAPVTISEYSFANGVLSVTVALTGTLPTNEENSNVDTFTTVALKAEIADDYKLDSEAGQDIFVFSDWARVYDVVSSDLTPYIHNVAMTDADETAGDGTHFWDYETVFTTGTETTPATYDEVKVFCVDSASFDKSMDLNSYVTVCDKVGNTYDVSKYPFAFEFSLVDFYCGEDDQADFATISVDETTGDYIITANGTMSDYRDAVDKYPVVQVVLKDTQNGGIVDVKYFAVKWVAEPLDDVEIALDDVYLHYRKIWGDGVANPGVDQAISEFSDEAFEALIEKIGLSDVDEFWTYYGYAFDYDIHVYSDEETLFEVASYTASDRDTEAWSYHHGYGFRVNRSYDSTDEDNDPLVTFGVYFPMVRTQHTYPSGTFAFPEVTCYDADGNETATYPEGDYDAAKYVISVTIHAVNNSICPDIVITQTVYDTDDCGDFTLSPLYKIADPSVYGLESDDPAVLCKGQLVDGAWTMYTNVEEHFEGGSIFAQVDEGVDNVTGLVFDWAEAYTYTDADGDEQSMVDPEYNDGVGGVIVEGDSNVGLQASLADKYYVTNMVYSQVLANSEYCPHDYYIVFENPFVDGEGIAEAELTDGVGENTAETAEQVVIYDTYGELVLSWDADEANGGENAGFVISDYAASLYGLDIDDVTITYAVDEKNGDWAYLQEQIANLQNVTLAVDESTGEVTWMNEGTRLQGQYTIYVVATVDFGVATATCTVTVILNPTGVEPTALYYKVL